MRSCERVISAASAEKRATSRGFEWASKQVLAARVHVHHPPRGTPQALTVLVGLQLGVFWIIMCVLDDLSRFVNHVAERHDLSAEQLEGWARRALS